MKCMIDGGTIFRHKAGGDEIYWLIVTGISEDTGWSNDAVTKRDNEIDAVAKKQGLLFESYVQINSSGILSVHGDLTLNSVDRIEVRVAPLCLGDLRLKQIVLKRA